MKFKIKWLILFALVIIFLPRHTAAAENFKFSESSTWELKTDTSVAVSSTLKVTNLTDNYYATAFSFWLPADSITNVTASYDDGTAIDVKQQNEAKTVNGLTYDYKRIDLSFSKQIVGRSQSFNARINYILNGSLKQKGQVYELVLPSFSDTMQIDKTIIVKAPKTLGAAHFLTGDPSSSRVDTSFNYFSFSDANLTASQQIIDFGDAMSRELDYNYQLQNSDVLPSFFKIYLPMNSNYQTAYLSSISPEPYLKGSDSSGSNFLYFFLLPGQKVDVQAKIQILTKGYPANIDRTGKMSEIPADLASFTSSAKYWETTDPQIQKLATELIKPNDTVFTNASRVYDYVISKLSYNQAKLNNNVRLGAVGALARPDYAVCQEYADLYVAILRAGGIPTREPYGFTDSQELRSSEGNILHAWAEVYLPKFGWLAVDPTWGEAGIKFDRISFDHLAIDYDLGTDFSRPVVEKNHQPYDYGQLLTSATFSDIKTTATGQTLALADSGKTNILDNNRVYLIYVLVGLIVLISLIVIIVKISHRPKDTTV